MRTFYCTLSWVSFFLCVCAPSLELKESFLSEESNVSLALEELFTYLLKYCLSSLACFFSFWNSYLRIHYNFCIYPLVLLYLLCGYCPYTFAALRDFFRLFFQASVHFSTVAVPFFSTSAAFLKLKLVLLSASDGGWTLSLEISALLQPLLCWQLPTQGALLILPYLQCCSPCSHISRNSDPMSYGRLGDLCPP